MDYTIVGGAVNLASRLEQEAPAGGILVSYETHALVKDEVAFEACGEVRVRGLAYAVATYRVIDLHANLASQSRRIHTIHPDIKIDLDLRTMTKADRQAAAELLEQALATLRC